MIVVLGLFSFVFYVLFFLTFGGAILGVPTSTRTSTSNDTLIEMVRTGTANTTTTTTATAATPTSPLLVLPARVALPGLALDGLTSLVLIILAMVEGIRLRPPRLRLQIALLLRLLRIRLLGLVHWH